MNPTSFRINKSALWVSVSLIMSTCMTVDVFAASLFGDMSCQVWTDLDYPRKKTWTNAFLAPLSLTHQGIERTMPDRYNDDPKAFEPAIVSIDNFCRSNPKLGAADGAVSYLNALIKNEETR